MRVTFDGTRNTLEGRAIVNGDEAHKFANVWDKLVRMRGFTPNLDVIILGLQLSAIRKYTFPGLPHGGGQKLQFADVWDLEETTYVP